MNLLDSSLHRTEVRRLLTRLGIGYDQSGVCHEEWTPDPAGEAVAIHSPADGAELATVLLGAEEDYDDAVYLAQRVWPKWRDLPAPRRGLIIREMAEALRAAQDDLGALIALETGKILAEGKGEVQEMIDVADFAVGLSRQLYGLTMPSERPGHRLMEQWHPLGVVGCITAFNFPAAVWSWNAFVAAVCGNCVVWKPSERTPLTAIAVQKICGPVLERHGFGGVFTLVCGAGAVVGERMTADRRLPLISATGSTGMGRRVAEIVGGRLGRTLLELGGNNAAIVMADADPQLAVRALLFGAVGTAGQRCTSIRRILVQRSVADEYREYLERAWGKVRIGHPWEPKVLCGPLIDRAAVRTMQETLGAIREQGGEVIHGGEPVELDFEGKPLLGGCYVRPALVVSNGQMPAVKEELFAPVVHLIEFEELEEAIALNNAVPQGLASAIFTESMRAAEQFLSARGSDCGIANVNIGTSGAEIGGAFGGEKDTGGGRESGSDSWKAYMRRQTATINSSRDLPLAEGIRFDL
jgi:aldehyde dehydrogenase (NAD+)